MRKYTVSDVATAIGVSPSSVRNWTDNELFHAFLSNTATRLDVDGKVDPNKEREYTEDDIYILNTIAKHKTRTNSWEDVGKLLDEGFRDFEMPPSAAMVMIHNQAEAFQALAIARQEISTLREQLDRLLKVDDERQEQIGKLNREVGKWQALAELYKSMLDEKNDGDKK